MGWASPTIQYVRYDSVGEIHMAIPDYQSFMLPLLRFAGDGKEHRVRNIYEPLADQLGLSVDDRQELLPSGKQFIYRNRAGWARTYMVKAGLLDAPRHGVVKITDRGRQVLERNLDRIDVDLLSEFPEFVEFKSTKVDEQSTRSTETSCASTERTPDEILEETHRELRGTLAHELLAEVKRASPSFFEHLVIDLLVRMGYGGSHEDAARPVGRSGDEGIDGIINEDRLGLDVIYLQAKRWENPVGRPEIQKFVGALLGRRSKKGIFITTSVFTKEAVEYARSIDSKVVLIDGARLAQLMFDFDIGVSTQDTYVTKRIDTDYFPEE